VHRECTYLLAELNSPSRNKAGQLKNEQNTLTFSFPFLQAKMDAGGCSPSAISAFESTFKALVSGSSGMIGEDTIEAVPELDHSANFTNKPDASLLAKTVVLKLNGGLGTGMGLDKAKSLLKVKGEDTFLDLTAKQVIQMRQDYGLKVKFMVMNSFSTSADTLEFFNQKYPSLAGEEGLELMQNKVPKLDATTFEASTVLCCTENPKRMCSTALVDCIGSNKLSTP
jgi:phosphoglucomutase